MFAVAKPRLRFVPTAVSFPPAIATASALGIAGFIVWIVAFTMTSSGALPCAQSGVDPKTAINAKLTARCFLWDIHIGLLSKNTKVYNVDIYCRQKKVWARSKLPGSPLVGHFREA